MGDVMKLFNVTFCTLFCFAFYAVSFAGAANPDGPAQRQGAGSDEETGRQNSDDRELEAENGGQPGRGFRGGQGRGRGGQGRGFGPGRGDTRREEDQEVFQFLLENHQKIVRKVTEVTGGVETLTESDDPEVASKIKEHVKWMAYRVENKHPIRMRDPLFAELFKHAEKIHMQHESTEKGVRVIETSDDPYVTLLIRAHAKVVSAFVKSGFTEARKNHSVPEFKPDQIEEESKK
jgi:uncharacterized protein